LSVCWLRSECHQLIDLVVSLHTGGFHPPHLVADLECVQSILCILYTTATHLNPTAPLPVE